MNNTCYSDLLERLPNFFSFPYKERQQLNVTSMLIDKYSNMNLHWPNWKNYDEPQSIIIPPVFNYKFPESANPNQRKSDAAEHIVYKAIQQLIEDGIQRPFIAVHRLDIAKLKGNIKNIFYVHPDEYIQLEKDVKECFREYDFFLIGPNIGIVVIEVKSSNYENSFEKANKDLPDGYAKGFVQVNVADALMHLVQGCTGFSMPSETRVRKIVFTPNLERKRYENWKSTLSQYERLQLQEKIGDVMQWFEEATANVPGKPPLYYTLRQLLQNGVAIPRDMYEFYGPAILAMASITVLPPYHVRPAVTLVRQAYWFEIAGANANASTECVQHLHEWPHPQMLLFLSPNQQKASNGPCRQIILGAAGTGKTTVLQTKAIELIEHGELVTVFAPKSSMLSYRNLFDRYSFKNPKLQKVKNYKVLCWSSEMFTGHKWLRRQDLQLTSSNFRDMVEEWLNDPDEVKRMEAALNKQHIIIDDAFDEDHRDTFPEFFLFESLLIMAFARRHCPGKVVWAAVDPLAEFDPIDGQKTYYKRVMLEIFSNNTQCESSFFAVTVLPHILRYSSTEYFQNVYSPKIDICQPEFRPMLRSNIEDVDYFTKKGNYLTETEAKEALWHQTEVELFGAFAYPTPYDFRNIRLEILDIEISDIAIIGSEPVKEFLRQKCQEKWPHLEIIGSGSPDNACVNLLAGDLSSRVLTVTSYDKVSSIEWPMVIFVYCGHLHAGVEESSKKHIDNQRYRALSRATVRLVDICVTYAYADENAAYKQYEENLEIAEKFKSRGNALFQLGKYALASIQYNEVIRLLKNETNCQMDQKKKRDDLYRAAQNNLALVYINMNATTEAVILCDNVLKEDPNNAKAWYRRGQALQQRNNWNHALKSYEKVCELEPNNKEARNKITECKQQCERRS